MSIEILIGLGVLALWLTTCTFVLAMCVMARRGDAQLAEQPPHIRPTAMVRGRAMTCPLGSEGHADPRFRRGIPHARIR